MGKTNTHKIENYVGDTWYFSSHETSLEAAERKAKAQAILWPTRILELPSLKTVWNSEDPDPRPKKTPL